MNVDKSGKQLVGNNNGLNLQEPPKIGDLGTEEGSTGTSYHAISANGEKVFFAALANEDETNEVGTPDMNLAGPTLQFFQTLYARVKHAETVTISAPECETTEIHGRPSPARSQAKNLAARGMRVPRSTARRCSLRPTSRSSKATKTKPRICTSTTSNCLQDTG